MSATVMLLTATGRRRLKKTAAARVRAARYLDDLRDLGAGSAVPAT